MRWAEMTLDEQERGPSRSRGSDVFVVEQDSFGGAVEIVELAAAQRPQERARACQAQEQRDRIR